MGMRGALSVDGPSGERWDLAVDLLTRGDGIVSFGPLLLYRDANGANADGRLHVEVCSPRGPEHQSTQHAESEVAAAFVALDAVLADGRVADIANRHGVVREYVWDYDTGRVLLGTIDPDGVLIWARDSDNA